MPQPVLTGNVRLQEGAIYIPSLDEQGAAKEATAANWATEMGAN